jgi:hypothetical protein
MSSVVQNLPINAPRALVWAVLVDLENWPRLVFLANIMNGLILFILNIRWMPNVDQASMAGEAAVGTTMQITMTVNTQDNDHHRGELCDITGLQTRWDVVLSFG